MTAYHQIIKSKLTSIFGKSGQSGDWAACWLRVNQLVTTESDRSFRNVIRWAKRNRIGWSPIVSQGDNEVVQEETDARGERF
jgi:hypothetical protein